MVKKIGTYRKIEITFYKMVIVKPCFVKESSEIRVVFVLLRATMN